MYIYTYIHLHPHELMYIHIHTSNNHRDRKYKFVRDWLPAMTEADSMRLNKILALVAPLLLLILLSIIPPIFGVLTRCAHSSCVD